MSRFASGILIFEKRPRWEAKLKRQFAGRKVVVRPCRSTADVRALAERMPGSVVLLDLDAGAEDCLRLVSLTSLGTDSFPVVIGPAEYAELEWPLRELGAAAFLSPATGGREIAALCARLLGLPTA